MCGILACVGHAPNSHFTTCLDQLVRRGPDGRGELVLPAAQLGHTRLSILDLAGGAQPMSEGDCSITYNGEVYNYRELQRRHLPGLSLRGHSDTEVLLHLYARLGASMVSQLDGMFAFVIVQGRRCFAARDPFGIKPLYYSEGRAGRLWFASELKAFPPGLGGIREFPPGWCYDSVEGWRQYYCLPSALEPFKGTPSQARARIRQVLGDAVEKRLLADVPVGVSLSGGLDSSIIALLAAKRSPHMHSFAVGSEGSRDLAAAQLVADRLGTRHHEILVTEADLIGALPDVLRSLESFDPALVRSAMPNYFLARRASAVVKVILTGEGADELYAGYEYMSRLRSGAALQSELLGTVLALHNTNLQRTDRMTMAFGLEGRVPFLDRASVELALSLPPEWKLHGAAAPKALLRDAFRRHLPASIIDRPKEKFSQGAGTRGWLEAYAQRSVSDSDFHHERTRLRVSHGHELSSKEALYYYRLLRETLCDERIFAAMGTSRSL